MPHNMQVKLLRVLQTGEVNRIGARKPVQTDVRIIASTHVDLSKAVSKGQFREDLYYRLNVFPIDIPALRERGEEDILLLANFFLRRNKVSPPKLSVKAKEALIHHHWPGNVREMENTIMRALHMGEKDLLDICDLGLTAPISTQSRHSGTLQEIERQVITETIEQTGSNMAATAKKLGISRATLYRKIKEYSL
jgi:DNA-binding NtrC family response regulator